MSEDLFDWCLDGDGPQRGVVERQGGRLLRCRSVVAVALDRAGDFGAAARAADSAVSMDGPPDSSRDPFFDRPYEPTAVEVAPAWEATAKAAAPVPGRGLSPNIRPKKKVAALLGGSS